MSMKGPLLAGILAIFLISLVISPARAEEAADFDIPGGHFFKQANGQGGDGGTGFGVTDEGGVAFWNWFQRLGGVDKVGYPVSGRFTWKNFTVQAFQKVVFQWRAESESVALVNVFDELAASGKDDWLSARSVPKGSDWASDQGKTWEQVVQNHQALLDQNPAIKAAYLADGDPITMNGLPMAAQDYGNVYVVRAQRKVFQQWKEATPWARAGEVTVANGGDLGKEAGLYPASAMAAGLPAGTAATPPASGVGASVAVADREAMASIANRVWPIWATVVAVDQVAGKQLQEARGDRAKMAAIIDSVVKAVEPLVPIAESLVAPDVAYAPALVAQVKEGVPLYYDAVKRLNWGLVSNDDKITAEALEDLLDASEALQQALWEFKAGIEKQGLRYENGKWQ